MKGLKDLHYWTQPRVGIAIFRPQPPGSPVIWLVEAATNKKASASSGGNFREEVYFSMVHVWSKNADNCPKIVYIFSFFFFFYLFCCIAFLSSICPLFFLLLSFFHFVFLSHPRIQQHGIYWYSESSYPVLHSWAKYMKCIFENIYA